MTKRPKKHGDVWQVFLPDWVREADAVKRNVHLDFKGNPIAEYEGNVMFGITRHKVVKTPEGDALYVEGSANQYLWGNPEFKSFIISAGSLVRSDYTMSTAPGDVSRQHLGEALYWNEAIWTIGFLIPSNFDVNGDVDPWHHDAPSLRELLCQHAEDYAEGYNNYKMTAEQVKHCGGNSRLRCWLVLYRLDHIKTDNIADLIEAHK